jgi:phosphoglycerate dehydrogenase-like enzyme
MKPVGTAWALDEGLRRGIGLDVMPVEPPPMDHPILQQARAIVTPHGAWYSTASAKDLRRKYAEQICRECRHLGHAGQGAQRCRQGRRTMIGCL